MSDQEDEFRQFNQPVTEFQGSSETYEPDLSNRGYFAPQSGQQITEFGLEREPLKGRKTAGGVISIIVGIMYILGYLAVTFSGMLNALLLSWFLLIAINVPILIIVGGGIGLGRATRVGAVLTFIGNVILVLLNLMLPVFENPGTYAFSPPVIVLLIVSSLGFLGSIILFKATQKAYYVD